MHLDGLEALHGSILAFKRDPSSGVTQLEAEKALSSFVPSSLPLRGAQPFLLDLESILENDSISSSLFKSILTFFKRAMTSNEELRRFLRDKSGLFRLAIHFLSARESSSKAPQLLQLLRCLSLGYKVPRFEWPILQKLLVQLKKFIVDDDREMTALSVFILLCLCKTNPIIVKSLLLEEELQSFFIQKQNDAKLQVLFHMLNVSLIQASEVEKAGFDSFSAGNVVEIKEMALLIVEAFCGAYTDDDVLFMRLLIDFWSSSIKNDRKMRKDGVVEVLSFVKSIVQLADFGDGANEMSNECLFSFLRLLVQSSEDGIGVFDVMIKLVALRLEASSPNSPIREAVLALRDSAFLLGDDAEIVAQNESDQVSVVISRLVDLASSKDMQYADRLAVYQTLRSISIADFHWADKVVSKVSNPSKLIQATLESITQRSDVCHSLLLLELIRFCKDLNDLGWKKEIEEDILKNQCVVGQFSTCLKNRCHSPASNAILQILASLPNNKSVEGDDDVQVDLDNEFPLLEFYRPLPSVLEDKIDSTIYSIQKTMENNDLDNLSSVELYELGNFQKYTADRKSEVLQVSLNAAENTIASQRKLNIILESQVEKLTRVLSRMVERDDARRDEIFRIRAEFESNQSSTNSLKKEIMSALEEKNQEFNQLQEEYDKLRGKAVKYKEDIETLQTTIQEHHKVQKELQENLKSEKKVNSEMVSTLDKLEAKLRKKERLLDEEMHSKQRIEKEFETLKKDFSSYQALSKRQLEKKEKQIAEQNEELTSMKQIQDQIFNLSKSRAVK